jgi:hypothetical protein
MWLRDVYVRANELALTKAHVSLEGERHAGTGRRVGSGAAAADMRQSDDPLKSVIRDGSLMLASGTAGLSGL